MRHRIRIPAIALVIAVVIAAGGTLALNVGNAYGEIPDELLGLVPENAESLVYLRDLKKGLSPFLGSDYYGEVSDLSVFDGPFKSDLSAPLLTKLGDFEKSTGIRPTPRRILWMVGKRAVFFTTRLPSGPASAGIIETGFLRRLVIGIASVFSGGVAKEDWGTYSVWVVTAGERHLYYKSTKEYTLFSDSAELFKAQWEAMSGGAAAPISNDPRFAGILSRLPGDYHILSYSTRIMNPDPEKKGVRARLARLLKGTDAVAAAVTFTETGLDATVLAPYAPTDDAAEFIALGALADAPPIDLGQMPGETAALVAFRAFEPGVLYTHFSKSWFGDVTERIAYVSVLKTWNEKGGFDLEGGIINNLGTGAAVALTGLGWEADKPHLKMIASVGVKSGGEAALSENLAKLFTYSFFDAGPQDIMLDGTPLSYMGVLREKTLAWNGSAYDLSVKANPGFALREGKLYLFWDLSTMQRLIDSAALSSMNKKTGGLFDSDFLVESTPFIDAQKKIAADGYDLYAYVDGNNAVSVLEEYLVNLSANYRYFLYQDSEKRLLPLLELTRSSFVSCSGGVNFTADAIEGTFTLTAKDIDD